MSDAVLLFVGSLVPVFAFTLALAAGHTLPDELVGTPIGTDLLLDARFGDAGSAIANFNDAGGTWDQPVRVVSAAVGWASAYQRGRRAEAHPTVFVAAL